VASSLEKLEASYPVIVQWHSFELRPRGTPPLSPAYRAKIQAGRPRLYATAREHYGLELNQGPFGIDSRPALIGAKYAEQMGVGLAYHAAVMRAYWQAAKNIEEIDELAEIAGELGLNRMAFMDALDSASLEQAVLDDIAQAQEYGINAVPSLIFANKYLVSGAQPYAVLTQVVEQIAKEQ
jgi:predicted DsbA family dithiol-disulfide isomerase